MVASPCAFIWLFPLLSIQFSIPAFFGGGSVVCFCGTVKIKSLSFQQGLLEPRMNSGLVCLQTSPQRYGWNLNNASEESMVWMQNLHLVC